MNDMYQYVLDTHNNQDNTMNPDLFVTPDGRPMVFYMNSVEERLNVKALVEAGGGIMVEHVSPATSENVIRLLVGTEMPDSRTYDMFGYSYVLDCVKENKILPNLRDYKVKSGFPSPYGQYDPLDVLTGVTRWSEVPVSGEIVSDIEDEDVDDVTDATKEKMSIRMAYSDQDRKEIVEALVSRAAYSQVKGNYIWKKLAEDHLCNGTRTWQSMKEHFKKVIGPNIASYELTWEQIQWFRSGMGLPTDMIGESSDDPVRQESYPAVGKKRKVGDRHSPPDNSPERSPTVRRKRILTDGSCTEEDGSSHPPSSEEEEESQSPGSIPGRAGESSDGSEVDESGCEVLRSRKTRKLQPLKSEMFHETPKKYSRDTVEDEEAIEDSMEGVEHIKTELENDHDASCKESSKENLRKSADTVIVEPDWLLLAGGDIHTETDTSDTDTKAKNTEASQTDATNTDTKETNQCVPSDDQMKNNKTDSETKKKSHWFKDDEYRKMFRQPYSHEEETAVVEFLMAKGGYSLVKGNRVWKEMEEAKICPGRSGSALQQQFLNHISKRLDEFEVTEEDLKQADERQGQIEAFTAYTAVGGVSPTRRGYRASAKYYTKEEDQAILDFILNNRVESSVGGVSLWQGMIEKDLLPGRTWQSIKERFRKSILKRLDSFNVTPEQKERLTKRKRKNVKKEELGQEES